ncbi:MAG: ParB/RepB/Spo0J family partition protein [Planctomycetota bacterium]|nr:MAG: ParB/RepB/Spo0J family partition protein [Planctomycetota bacterium]
MQKSQKRLGRGLSSLISTPDAAVSLAAEPQDDEKSISSMVKINQIRSNPLQPRKEMPPEQLESLAKSIKKTGVIQPIVLRPIGDQAYEIIVGERRWRAGQIAGLKEIPAIVRDASNEEMLEFALIENIYREDLNAIDRASAYKQYCDKFDLTPEDVAKRLGEDRTTVTNYIRLLDLPSEVKSWVITGDLSMGHARCLLSLKSPSDIIKTAKAAVDQALPVRALEKIVRQRVEARASASKSSEKPADSKRPQIRSLEESFTRSLGTKVEINESRRKGSGKITIHYYTLDDFDRIISRMGIEVE